MIGDIGMRYGSHLYPFLNTGKREGFLRTSNEGIELTDRIDKAFFNDSCGFAIFSNKLFTGGAVHPFVTSYESLSLP